MCERAYEAALELAAWCGAYEIGFLKKYYEQSCGNDWFTQMAQSVPDGLEDDCSDEEGISEQILARVGEFFGLENMKEI